MNFDIIIASARSTRALRGALVRNGVELMLAYCKLNSIERYTFCYNIPDAHRDCARQNIIACGALGQGWWYAIDCNRLQAKTWAVNLEFRAELKT